MCADMQKCFIKGKIYVAEIIDTFLCRFKMVCVSQKEYKTNQRLNQSQQLRLFS